MRLLFIAPSSNLASNSELARIASGNTLEIADGALDRAGLERALRDPYDAVHFCGHGGKSVLQLSDGLIDAADLVSMLDRQRCALFFFLNSCDSLAVGTAVHNSLHVPCVCHDAEIGDVAAVRFAERFYREFKRAQDVGASFEAARETLLRLFPDAARIPVLINGDMLTDAQVGEFMNYVKSEIEAMHVKIDDVAVAVKEIKGGQSRMLLVFLGLLLLAQLATPWLNSVFSHLP